MSVFGGDSWGRDAQQRKRRLDDLMLPASASSAPDSFKRLANGKFACLVCPHRPVLDSPLMLSMHNKGARHMAAESGLREKELSKQHELNKRMALSSDNSPKNSDNLSTGIVSCNMKEKPLIEQTRMAILEAQSNRLNNLTANKVSCDQKRMANDSSCGFHVSPGVPMENLTGTGSIEFYSSKGEPFGGNQTTGVVLSESIGLGSSKGEPFGENQTKGVMLSEWQADVRKRKEEELRFTASGWKRDCHGKWYRDENVEFDSDEDDPNICLS